MNAPLDELHPSNAAGWDILDQAVERWNERSALFDRAWQASKANDSQAFDEAINAFWNTKGRERQRFGDNPLQSDR